MIPRDIKEEWNDIHVPVANTIKIHLLKKYQIEIYQFFKPKVDYLVQQYFRHLPKHVKESEKDDLNIIAQLELFETLKSWIPDADKDVWPLAYSRINGAMKDHIRYITKSDPTRFYDWITDAAHLFIVINQNKNDFEKELDNKFQLKEILQVLTEREKMVVLTHTKHDKTFLEISKAINVSESQVSRIYKKAIDKIRRSLKVTSKD